MRGSQTRRRSRSCTARLLLSEGRRAREHAEPSTQGSGSTGGSDSVGESSVTQLDDLELCSLHILLLHSNLRRAKLWVIGSTVGFKRVWSIALATLTRCKAQTPPASTIVAYLGHAPYLLCKTNLFSRRVPIDAVLGRAAVVVQVWQQLRSLDSLPVARHAHPYPQDENARCSMEEWQPCYAVPCR